MNRLQEKENTFVNNFQTSLDWKPFGLYIHVPFCASTCSYCNFYQKKPKKSDIQLYLKSIRKEFEQFPPPREADTVFFGGGTPGILKEEDLKELCQIVKPFLAKEYEWSLEMAPSAVKPNKMRMLKELGINRISMGIQSFNPNYLDKLGRLHSADKARAAFHIIRNEGFKNVNIDFIFAVPGQTEEDWTRELDQAFALDPEHISTYCLIFEEDAALYLKFSQGILKKDENLEAKLFESTWTWMRNHGYKQYEIANYAKPGFSCKHNLNTWRMHEWRGYGPAAASQQNNQRFSNISSLSEWAHGIQNKKPHYFEFEKLSEQKLFEDCILFGLRMNEGVDLRSLRSRFPNAEHEKAKELFHELESHQLIHPLLDESSHLRLTNTGRLLADQIGVQLLERMA